MAVKVRRFMMFLLLGTTRKSCLAWNAGAEGQPQYKFDRVLDGLPAADTNAALEITGLRHAPLAAP
jgi:hypothetical protein